MKTRKSEIDRGNEISEDRWLLTLARKITTGLRKEHAFFILEGVENGKATIWFMDLVGNPLLPNIKKSKIRVKNFEAASEEELRESPLLYRCSIQKKGMYAEMMDLEPNVAIVRANNTSWPIDKEDAQQLINTIKEDEKEPPVFNIFGQGSVLTKASASSSSKDRGHNCFTYAKEKIVNLDVPSIKLECDKTAYCMEHIADLTSFTLRSPKSQAQGNCCSSFWKPVAVLGLITVAGIALDQVRRTYTL